MANCKEQVYSNDFLDFIISYGESELVPEAGACIQRIDEGFDIFFYPREGTPPLSVSDYSYHSIPKCYGLLDQTALEVSGILRMQNQPTLSLKGNGVLVGLIDTGIDYTNPLFRYSDGSTRILSIWDQTIRDGTPPAGILYGAEYLSEEINRALESEAPYDIVPSRDEDGHGTFVAGVACGGEDAAHSFVGAAPQSQLAVVKLKEAKQYLREFFFLPDGVPAYQENDIMMAVSYLNGLANIYNMPLVLCIALGNSMGNHGKNGALSSYLNSICIRRKRAVVVAVGNEANAGHHFHGEITGNMTYEDAEITVEEDIEGFFVEMWADAPELYAVSIISPTGERLPGVPVRSGVSQEYRFLFEGTTVTIGYRIETTETASQLIFIRFQDVKRGSWIVRVFPQSTITGRYNMWMPLQSFTMGNTFFLRSNPDTTITTPAYASRVISVGGYNATNGSIYTNSGRGYTTSGEIKPDFVAPAVEVYGPGLRHNYIAATGTSASAAITAGACAQIMQWALVDQNEPSLSNAGMKNMLIRGTNQPEGRNYPNREWGYGTLDVYHAFEQLRG